MAVHDDIGADLNGLADETLHGEASSFHRRRRALDGDSGCLGCSDGVTRGAAILRHGPRSLIGQDADFSGIQRLT